MPCLLPFCKPRPLLNAIFIRACPVSLATGPDNVVLPWSMQVMMQKLRMRTQIYQAGTSTVFPRFVQRPASDFAAKLSESGRQLTS